MTSILTAPALKELLLGTHNDATAPGINALAQVLVHRPQCFGAERARTSLLEAVMATLSTGNNCVGCEDYALLDRFVENRTSGLSIDDALEKAYHDWHHQLPRPHNE